jgi:hypothetical protein
MFAYLEQNIGRTYNMERSSIHIMSECQVINLKQTCRVEVLGNDAKVAKLYA